jgi:hypothetical protein
VRPALALALLSLCPLGEARANSPAQAVASAFTDISRVKKSDRVYQRYLWAPNPSADFRKLISFHANLLSTAGDFGTPTWVHPDLARLDMRDYGWDARAGVWEKFGKNDVYFHQRVRFAAPARVVQFWPGGKERGRFFRRGKYARVLRAGAVSSAPGFWLPQLQINALRAHTYSEAPVLNAEWWFVQTARQLSIRNVAEGTGYYDLLGLEDRRAFFRLVGLNEAVAQRTYQEWRAVVAKSGVSAQNRQVVALRATTGRVWFTLDTFHEQGRGIAKRNLRRGEFKFDVQEIYGYLPNGLPVTFLADAKGVAQATAPDTIGPDDSSLRRGRDGRIHANLSCIRCHGLDRGFLKPIDDWARKTFSNGGRPLSLQDYDRDVLLELRRQYLADLNRMLRRDREDYAAATIRLTGLDVADMTRLYGRAWNAYVERVVTRKLAAAELGVTEEVFVRQLRLYAAAKGGADLVLVGYLDDPAQELTRLEWEDSYAFAQAILHGVPPEVPKKIRAIR